MPGPSSVEDSDQLLVARWARDIGLGAMTAASSESVDTAGVELIARWRQPHRRYHTVTHLVAVLNGIDELTPAPTDAIDLAAVRLAAWFHDAVYQGRPGLDEEDSAQLAEWTLPDLGWPAERVAEVARLVRLTADHAGIASGDDNAAVLADADLAVPAAPEPEYLRYTVAVRQEYEQVPDDLFRAGRAQILTRLLESPLYRTPAAQARWTTQATANLRAEIARLVSD
jgi:predicted metal-dependent HD superfamily phosphohydrolase